jgi:hypothetical protein
MLVTFEKIQQKYDNKATAKVVWREMLPFFPDITRENVSSKLQKWRLKRVIQDPKFAMKWRHYRKSSSSSSSSSEDDYRPSSTVPKKGASRKGKSKATKRAPMMIAPVNTEVSSSKDILSSSSDSILSMSDDEIAQMLVSL